MHNQPSDMAPKHEPNTPRTHGPSVRNQERAYISSTDDEYELTSDTDPYEPIPNDPPPSYRSHKTNPSDDDLNAPSPPPFSAVDITITPPADAARPASPPPSPPPYPPPMQNPLRRQPTQTRASTANTTANDTTTNTNNRHPRKYPQANNILCATALILAAVAAALAVLFACTVAVLSIARPRRVTYQHAGAFFALAGYAMLVEVGVLVFAGGVYWGCCSWWKKRRGGRGGGL